MLTSSSIGNLQPKHKNHDDIFACCKEGDKGALSKTRLGRKVQRKRKKKKKEKKRDKSVTLRLGNEVDCLFFVFTVTHPAAKKEKDKQDQQRMIPVSAWKGKRGQCVR